MPAQFRATTTIRPTPTQFPKDLDHPNTMSNITVATLNLRNRQDRWLKRRGLIVAELLNEQPDLIGLQEIYIPIRQGYWLRNQLNSRTSGAPYRLIQARKRHPVKAYFEGVGILTKLPVLATDIVSLGYEGRVAVRANVELPTGTTLDFVSVHLHHLPQDQQARLEQVLRLVSWLNERNPVPCQIVVGDFNETPQAPAILQMKAKYRSAFQLKRGYEPLATFPTALVGGDWAGCLDYIFISSAINKVQEAHLFCKKASPQDDTLYPSDHVGLLAELLVEDTA